MTIAELGSLGEFFASIAVLITLIFLAIQIRGNTKIARSQSQRELLNTHPIFQPTALDGDLARIVRAGLDHFGDLPRDDQVRFNSWMHPLGNQVEACFRMYGQGLMEEGSWVGFRDAWLGFVTTPGGADWWRLSQHVFGQDFSRETNERIRSDRDGIVAWSTLLPYYGWEEP